MLVKREQGDPETIALWKKMNARAIDGQAETYKRYGTHIDKAYLESAHYLKGKALVEQ
jgi:arginyl-tRNA synthetase